jgi:hypothetical protein
MAEDAASVAIRVPCGTTPGVVIAITAAAEPVPVAARVATPRVEALVKVTTLLVTVLELYPERAPE